MTRLLLTTALLAACTNSGADTNADKPLCKTIDDDMTYLNEYPMAACDLDLSGVGYYQFPDPFDPNAEPYPIFLSGWERASELPGNPLVKASNAPVVKVREDVYRTSAVLHGGERGRTLVLDEKIERCEWVRCR